MAKNEGNKSVVTTDHNEIRRWAEARDAQPACVKGTGRDNDDAGILRMDLPGYTGEETLQKLDWAKFFEAFEENELAFLYQEETASGEPSNFNKLISRYSE